MQEDISETIPLTKEKLSQANFIDCMTNTSSTAFATKTN